MYAFRIAPALVLSVLAAACAVLPEGGEPVRGPDAFELAGRVAVRYGAEGASGRLAWRHSAAADDLLISSPLGQGLVRLTRREGEVRLVTKDNKTYSAADAESLTENMLGWRLPLAGLPDWVRGRADPSRPSELVRDASGRLSELRQDTWNILYQEYDGARPSKLRLSRGEIEIRLVVDEWRGAP